ncbi:hypothetical protein BH09PSE2_BH09PSE2_04470 [soil metagenome]
MTQTPPPPPISDKAPAGAKTAKVISLRRRLGVFAVAAALTGVVLAGVAVVGVRQGWLSYAGGHGVMWSLAAPAFALLAVVLGLLTLVFGLVVAPRGVRGVIAIAVGAVTFLAVSAANRVPRDAAPVHEVSTDWRDPVMASPGLLAARGPNANPVEAAPALPEGPQGVMGRTVAELNAKTCPAALPITLMSTRDAAFAKAKAALQAEKLAVLTNAPADGRLEAVAVRGLFAQKDDVIVRVREEGAGARVDIRSTAREGATDGAANCARLGRLRTALTTG